MVWSMESPLNAMEQVQRMGANRLRGQVAQMDMMQQGQDMSNEMAMNALYKQVGGDPVAMQRELTKAGNMKGSMMFGKMNAGAQQAQQEAKLGDLAYRQKAHEYLGNRIYNSQSQQELDAIRQEGYGMLGDEMDNLPAEWSPEMARHYGEASMTFAQKEALAQKREEAAYRAEDRAFRREDMASRRADRAEKPVSWQTVQTADGFAQVNPQTGETRPVVVGGKQAQARPSAASMAAGSPQLRVRDAMDAIGIIEQAKTHLDTATASGLGTARDTAAGVFGLSTKGAQSAASLKALEGALVSKMPKMSGPQSDKDVLLYKQMAAQVGDSNIPIETRKAALATIEEMQRRYAGLDSAPVQSVPSGLSPESASFFGQ